MTRRPLEALNELARLHGVQLSYTSPLSCKRVHASPEAILAVLRALGAPLARIEDSAEALRAALDASRRRVLEPVVVVRADRTASVSIGSRAARTGRLRCRVRREDGRTLRWDASAARAEVSIPEPLPPGYHDLEIETPAGRHHALLVASPLRCHGAGGEPRFWGVFIPLHALGGRSALDAGSLSDLDRLMDHVGREGGSVVATLPILASYLDDPFGPSPYAPVSRLFWNEFFLDIEALPDFGGCARARRIAASAGTRKELRSMARAPLIDFRRTARLRRRILSEMADFVLEGSSPAKAALMRHVRRHPELERYARFRAVRETREEAWDRWPARLREGRITARDHGERERRYHLYSQWRTAEQIETLSRKAAARGQALYLDFPLGVRPDGYDVWRERGLFAGGASAGAPPDAFFSKGQNWGFPPVDPEAARARGYGYFRECLAHHMGSAGVLRIDHILGFHRVFWIPDGMPAGEGLYVRNRSEELYAILALESHRSGTMIVGEDLGTVPRDLRPAMRRHGVHRTFVLQFELGTGRRGALPAIPERCLAGLNTHDMHTFASYMSARDLEDARALGLLTAPRLREEKRDRKALIRSLAALLRRAGHLTARRPGRRQMLRALLAWIASSRARGLVLNVEDLWGEIHPQNTPGTTTERPNWKRKARYDLKALVRQPEALAIMRLVDRHRKERSR